MPFKGRDVHARGRRIPRGPSRKRTVHGSTAKLISDAGGPTMPTTQSPPVKKKKKKVVTQPRKKATSIPRVELGIARSLDRKR